MRLRIETRDVDDLRGYERNNKPHPQKQIDAIKASIERFGFNDPIGVTESGMIVEGHGRLEAARQLGIDEVPCIILPDDMTADMIDLYRIAHNKLALTSTFDFAKLADQLRDIVQGGVAEFAEMGFDSKAASSLFELVREELPVSGGGHGGGSGSASEEESAHQFDVVWDNTAQRDAFKAFTAKVVATYGGGSGDALAACLADVISGTLQPTGLTSNPATADSVENLQWD